MPGTIDTEGFRNDLASISSNDYPVPQLVKLPLNWFEQASGGIIQKQIAGTPNGQFPNNFPQSVTLPNTQNGNALLILVGCGHFPDPTGAGGVTCTDSQSNSYTKLVNNAFSFAIDFICFAFLAENIVGGDVTVTINGSVNVGASVIHAFEIGGVTGVRGTSAGIGSTGAVSAQPGDLAFAFGATNGMSNTQSWSENSGWTQQSLGPAGQGLYNWGITLTQSVAAAGNVSQVLTSPTVNNGTGELLIVLEGNFSASSSPITPPITSIPLNGPCNFIALVSEAIDENGNYFESALIGQQSAAGFLRLNGAGNVWFPVSFASPLMTGYVTTNPNYTSNPIKGTGFSSITAPFGTLDWQPASPIYYSGNTPPATQNYLLAFVGLNLGVGAEVGNGVGSTHAIPSAAGPVERLRKEGFFK